jgi:hypothetical protein
MMVNDLFVSFLTGNILLFCAHLWIYINGNERADKWQKRVWIQTVGRIQNRMPEIVKITHNFAGCEFS